MSVLISIADAIATELNTGFAASSFGASFQKTKAERSYPDWDHALEESGSLKVDVFPFGAKLETLTRGSWKYRVATDVGIRFRFNQEYTDESKPKRIEKAAVDRLVQLTEDVGEYFAQCQPTQTGRRLTAVPAAVWTPGGGDGGTDFRVWFNADHLKELRQFTGVVRLVYTVPRRASDS